MSDPFKARGAMSCRDACLQVFRGMAVNDWIAVDDLVHQVGELTGVEFSTDTVRSSAWSARETLAAEREVGVEHYMGGYKRLDPIGQAQAAEKRLGRVKRRIKGTVRWASAAAANPELPAEYRYRMQIIQRSELMQSELDARRAEKRRPGALPAASSDA